jgi:archaellum biogenesis protein FlaJ (TadC family)
MDLAGSTYLYALATVSITFVGFSALLLVFRQSMGGALTRYEMYFTFSFIQIGFIVTAGALLPPLLALYGLSQEVVWRISSIAIAIPVVWFVASVPARRRAATGRPIPAFVWRLVAVQLLAGLALVLRAVGTWSDSGAAVYASTLTTILFASGIAYLLALSVFLGPEPEK